MYKCSRQQACFSVYLCMYDSGFSMYACIYACSFMKVRLDMPVMVSVGKYVGM